MIDPSTVTIADLRREHPERKQWATAIEDFRLLYRGGEEFLRACGQVRAVSRTQDASTAASLAASATARRNPPRRFLHQLDAEPHAKYAGRWERAIPLLYVGMIVDYFKHWLFSSDPTIRVADPDEDSPATAVADGNEPAPVAAVHKPPKPDWFKPFALDCDGKGTRLLDFARDSFGDVLQTRVTGWAIGSPDMRTGEMSQADAEAEGLDGVRLTPYTFEEIVDWDEDPAGALTWIVLHKVRLDREFPAERKKVDSYLYLDRESWAAWEVTVGDEPGTEELRLIDARPHEFGEVPFVRLQVPFGLWVLNKIAGIQIDLFNQANMLAYGQLVSCFLQPWLRTNEGTGESQARVFGEANLLHLRTGDGQRGDEEFGWTAPDTTPLEFSSTQIDKRRDEMFRIVHQMSVAVNAQSKTAQASSGESKSEDRLPTEIILAGYGGYIRDALRRTLNLASKMLGDDSEWTVVGFDKFETRSLIDELNEAALLSTLSIPSPTFQAVWQTRIATGRAAGHIDEGTKGKIEDEIAEGVSTSHEGTMQAIQTGEMLPDGTPRPSFIPPGMQEGALPPGA